MDSLRTARMTAHMTARPTSRRAKFLRLVAAGVLALSLAVAASATFVTPAMANSTPPAEPAHPIFATDGLVENSGLVALGDKSYFTAYHLDDTFHLYSFDGLTVSVVPSPGIQPQGTPLLVGGDLYFVGFNEESNSYLYRFDGTSVAIVPDSPRAIFAPTVIGDKLYLRAAADGGWSDLFTYDGTSWQHFSGAGAPKGPGSFAALGDTVYMVASDVNRVNRMFGLKNGVFTVFNGPNDAVEPQGMTAFNGSLYYTDTACALGKFDGTTFTRLDPVGTPTCPSSFRPFNGGLYYAGEDANSHLRLSMTDGTTTSVVPDSPLYPRNLTVHAGVLYFTAWQDDLRRLFSFDGTTVTLINTSAYDVTWTGVINDTLYYDGRVGPDYAGQRAFYSVNLDALPQLITLPSSTVASGQVITITGSGFTPGGTVTVELHSTPVTLGTGIADGNGNISIPITIPDGAPAGSHEIWAIDGTSGYVSVTPVAVFAAASSGAELAQTSTPAVAIGALAVVFLSLAAAGILLSVAAKRSRRRAR